MTNEKVYSVQYISIYGARHACRLWENGKTKKFTLGGAIVAAKQEAKRTGYPAKVYKGRTLIEVFNP